MRAFAALFFVVSSAFAYQVTYPTNTQGWGTSGTNLLSWTRVDTDPLTFTAVLKNDQNSAYVQVLDSSVDGTTGSIYLNAPSGGWPTGSVYRVNLAQDAQHLDSLLAQSPQFNITSGNTSGGSSGSPGSSGTTTSTSSGTGTSSRTPTSTLSGGSSTSSDTSTTPTSSSAGFLAADARAGLLTAVVALTGLITTFF